MVASVLERLWLINFAKCKEASFHCLSWIQVTDLHGSPTLLSRPRSDIVDLLESLAQLFSQLISCFSRATILLLRAPKGIETSPRSPDGLLPFQPRRAPFHSEPFGRPPKCRNVTRQSLITFCSIGLIPMMALPRTEPRPRVRVLSFLLQR